MQMNEKKPHITIIWIAIAVVSINQAVGAYQNYQIHQRFRQRIESLQSQDLKLFHQMNKNQEVLESALDSALEILEGNQAVH